MSKRFWVCTCAQCPGVFVLARTFVASALRPSAARTFVGRRTPDSLFEGIGSMARLFLRPLVRGPAWGCFFRSFLRALVQSGSRFVLRAQAQDPSWGRCFEVVEVLFWGALVQGPV